MSHSANYEEHGMELREQSFSLPFIVLTSLFFMWGLVIGLNTALLENFKLVFSLSINQALIMQFAFFATYFVVAVPAGKLIDSLGYKNGIVIGLVTSGVGALIFLPAADSQSFNLLMVAIFVLASGITILQVAANPYIVLFGDPNLADERLSLKQGFNALGSMIAPIILAFVLFSPVHARPELLAEMTPDQIKDAYASDVKLPYMVISILMFVLAALMFFSKLPMFNTKNFEPTVANKSGKPFKFVIEFSHLRMGAIAVFAYMGAEIALSVFLNSNISRLSGANELQALNYLAFYYGGMMVGRFAGAYILPSFNLHKAVAFCAAGAVVLTIVGAFTTGMVSMWSLLLVGLFNAILFPAIFTLGLSGLGKFSEEGSSVLIMGSIGGAVVPLLVSQVLASGSGSSMALLIPAACYLFVVYYGLVGSKYTKLEQVKN
jgi:MFS transporter, FHS family, L-fucose permease